MLPLERLELPELVGEEDGASPSKIQEAVGLLPGGASLREGEESRGSGGGTKGLSGGKHAIVENSVRLKEFVETEDVVEAAALDNRNFIRVMVGNEPYLAQLDPGATISLVVPDC